MKQSSYSDTIAVFPLAPSPTVSLIARFMGPTWGPSGADRTQVGPMLAPWILLSGMPTVTRQQPQFTVCRCHLYANSICFCVWVICFLFFVVLFCFVLFCFLFLFSLFFFSFFGGWCLFFVMFSGLFFLFVFLFFVFFCFVFCFVFLGGWVFFVGCHPIHKYLSIVTSECKLTSVKII